MLKYCPQVRAFWDSFPPSIHSNLFYGVNLSDWLKINCTSHKAAGIGISWGIIFPFGVWSLWLRWNMVIFRNHTTFKPIIAETLAKVSEFAYLGLNERHKRTTCFINWCCGNHVWTVPICSIWCFLVNLNCPVDQKKGITHGGRYNMELEPNSWSDEMAWTMSPIRSMMNFKLKSQHIWIDEMGLWGFIRVGNGQSVGPIAWTGYCSVN